MKKLILLIMPVLLLTGCDEEETTNQSETTHTGVCLEYKTEYKLDCGLFTCKDTFCCERKYDKCIRWEE